MTTITLDDALIDKAIAVSHAKNAQEALTKIITFYLQQHKQQPAFFEQLCLADESADDDLALLFERNKDTGRNIEL